MKKILNFVLENKKNMLLAASALIAVGASLLTISLYKKVYFVLNGSPLERSTFALTVKHFLQEENLPVLDQDRLSPEPGKLLRGGEIIYFDQSRTIQILNQGKVIEVNTAEKLPGNILQEAGMPLFPNDEILLNGSPINPGQPIDSEPPLMIEFRPATVIRLRLPDQQLQFSTNAKTLAGALEQEGYTIFEGDRVHPDLNTLLTGTELEVEFTQSRPVIISLPDKELRVRSASSTVGEILADAALPLQGLDYSLPEENEPYLAGSPIQIIRVTESYVLNQEPIQFTSQYQPTNDLVLDQQQILTAGELGLKAQRVRVVSENGQEISREAEKEWVVKDPVPRIIGYGTRVEVQTANTADGQIKYWRKIEAYATSYNENCLGCSKWTASGTRIGTGSIAVRTDWFYAGGMAGMQVYIPGYGFGTIEDVGGGVDWSRNWVDLGYSLEDYQPWSSYVTVYFLTPVPSADRIMNPLY
jgi:uncharacterized protein YabE (DUF348 family)